MRMLMIAAATIVAIASLTGEAAAGPFRLRVAPLIALPPAEAQSSLRPFKRLRATWAAHRAAKLEIKPGIVEIKPTAASFGGSCVGGSCSPAAAGFFRRLTGR